LYKLCWDENPEKRPTITSVLEALKEFESEDYLSEDQKLVKAWKLNYGLYLAGNNFITSNKIILGYNEKLDIITYSGEPLVYEVVNDSLNKPKSFWSKLRDTYPKKLSSTNETANKIISDADICILFPIAVIKYTGSISKNFDSNFKNEYGHFIARKLLAGGKLIIRNFTKANSIQVESLKSHLVWTLDASNLQKENPFKNIVFDFPIIETTEQKFLKTSEDLIKWMKDLYEDNTVEIISYEEVVPIYTFLKNKELIETFTNRLVPEISDMHEELTFKDWISDLASAYLLTWIDKYHFHKGILIDQFGISPTKKSAATFTSRTTVSKIDDHCLQIIQPKTSVEEILSENNIDHDSSLISFIEQSTIILGKMEPTDTSYLFLQNKKIKISIENRCFIPLPNFIKAMEDALNDIKPYKALRKVFEEFGYFLPRTIILGNQIKESFYNSTDKSINPFKKQFTATSQDDIDKVFKEEIKYFVDKNLLTSNGQIIEQKQIFNWFSKYGNDDKHFKIIGMNLVPTYKILEDKLQNEVEIILNNRLDLKVLLTGIKAINVNEYHTETHFRINFDKSFDSNSFDVFGLVIDKHGVKLENCVVRFDLFDFYGFSAFVTFDQNKEWDIEERSIIWMVIGRPAKLGVFSKVHCETKITCYKTNDEDIKYDNSFVFITMPFSLEKNCIISFVASYSASNNPPKQNFRLLEWSNKALKLEIIRIFDKKNSIENLPQYPQNFLISVIFPNNIEFKVDIGEEKSVTYNSFGQILNIKDYNGL
ncbi:9493_t:CDS:2, partial [Dentiscutata erythropus]